MMQIINYYYYFLLFCRYRYTLDELLGMLHRLKVRSESFDLWANKVKEALEQEEGNKIGGESTIIIYSEVRFKVNFVLISVKSLIAVLKDLEVLKNEAAEKKFPDNELLRRLSAVLKDIERCQRTSTELLGSSATRYDGPSSM